MYLPQSTSSNKLATESSKQAAGGEASQLILARRSTRQRGREEDSAQLDASADGAVQAAEEVQQPSKASKQDQDEEHQQGTALLLTQPDASPASTGTSASAVAAAAAAAAAATGAGASIPGSGPAE